MRHGGGKAVKGATRTRSATPLCHLGRGDAIATSWPSVKKCALLRSAANIPMFAPPSPLVIVSCRWYLPARPITDPALHTRRGANDLKEEEEEKEEEKEERAELQLQLSSQVGMRAEEDKACGVEQPARQSGRYNAAADRWRYSSEEGAGIHRH